MFFEGFLNTSVDMHNIVIATLFKENYIKITQTGGKSILCTFVWGRSYIVYIFKLHITPIWVKQLQYKSMQTYCCLYILWNPVDKHIYYFQKQICCIIHARTVIMVHLEIIDITD